MLGNNIGPVINFKLKTLPLPFLVETPESTPYKRIFKFDCAVPDTTIKYEIIDYPCTQDKTTTPTTIYTNNQELTTTRPKKIKAIASKTGYKDSSIYFNEFKFNLDFDKIFEANVDIPSLKSVQLNTTVNKIKSPLYLDFKQNIDDILYKVCNDTSSTNIPIKVTYSYTNINPTWNSFSVDPTLSNNYYTVNTVIPRVAASSVESFHSPLYIKIELGSGTVDFEKLYGYSSTPVIKYVKPRFPRVTITQSFTGRPALITIKKDYEKSTTTFSQMTADSVTNANIYYTTDGTDPTTSSTLYTEPFLLNESCVLKAISISDKYDGTLSASYINVGELRFNNPLQKYTYTTSSNVSSITILRIDGGGQVNYKCKSTSGLTYIPSKAGMTKTKSEIDFATICGGDPFFIDDAFKEGNGIISKINTNTSTFYITAGKDASGTATTGNISKIIDSNNDNITGNIYSGKMNDVFITTYALSVMKLTSLINSIWTYTPSIQPRTEKYLNEYAFNYNLNHTISSGKYGGDNFYYKTKPILWPNLLSDYKPGIYIIEHYSN